MAIADARDVAPAGPQVSGLGDILHPAVLDSMSFPWSLRCSCLREGVKSTVVPTFIKELRIADTVAPSAAKFRSYASSEDNAKTFDVWVEDMSRAPGKDLILEAKGVRVTSLPGSVTLNQPPRELCHTVEFVTYVDAWTRRHRNEVCTSKLGWKSAAQRNHSLDALALWYIHRAIKEVNPTDIKRDHLRHWFERMQKQARVPLKTPEPVHANGSGVDAWCFWRGSSSSGSGVTHYPCWWRRSSPDTRRGQLPAATLYGGALF